MAIEVVDLPIRNGDFPWLCKRLPEGKMEGFSVRFPRRWWTSRKMGRSHRRRDDGCFLGPGPPGPVQFVGKKDAQIFRCQTLILHIAPLHF
jgi:hypothetical protein